MRRSGIAAAMVVLCLAACASADTFGTGGNQFDIDFVTISGATNPGSPIVMDYGYGNMFTFNGVPVDYRMGTYEIAADQWSKFTASLGVPVTGSPAGAYNVAPYWSGANMPASNISWFEAAQFVNWLNTSTGHHEAYNFTGTQGTADYALVAWDASQAAGGTNVWRHRDAFYFLPTEDEWAKAAYWNGSTLQRWATPNGDAPPRGDGVSGTGWRWGEATPYYRGAPWDVGSGSQELNGTFDMMGNVAEWAEDYATDTDRALWGGHHDSNQEELRRGWCPPATQRYDIGFRVASVPEPCNLAMLAIGAIGLIRRRRR